VTITRQTLPNDGWADLRDPAEVPERLRRPVRHIQMRLAKDPAFTSVVAKAKTDGVAAVADIGEDDAVQMATAMGEDAMTLMDDLNDRIVLSRVAGWSYGPDVTLAALQDLPGAVYDRLREVCADGALEQGPDFSPSPDPQSPTVPSTA